MDWLVRSLFGDHGRIEILPGLAMVCWTEAIETTTGMFVFVEKFKFACKWIPW